MSTQLRVGVFSHGKLIQEIKTTFLGPIVSKKAGDEHEV
jgi:hypothetical protein